jgi:hypothetical protein
MMHPGIMAERRILPFPRVFFHILMHIFIIPGPPPCSGFPAEPAMAAPAPIFSPENRIRGGKAWTLLYHSRPGLRPR